MQSKPTLSDLLALRDGELADAELAADIYAEPDSREALLKLSRIKASLNALPALEPAPEVWQAIERRTAARPRWLTRFPMATAATVFLAAALGIVAWNPAQQGEAPAARVAVTDPVADLVLRSQRLERQLFTQAAAPVLGVSSSEQALRFGIADVDAQLNALYESDTPDAGQRERLWRQRVMLLESLADVQRGQAVLRPAVY